MGGVICLHKSGVIPPACNRVALSGLRDGDLYYWKTESPHRISKNINPQKTISLWNLKVCGYDMYQSSGTRNKASYLAWKTTESHSRLWMVERALRSTSIRRSGNKVGEFVMKPTTNVSGNSTEKMLIMWQLIESVDRNSCQNFFVNSFVVILFGKLFLAEREKSFPFLIFLTAKIFW